MYEFKTALNTNTFVSLKILEALMQKDLTDEDKARIIAEGFAELEHRYPDLKHIATKQDLSETELKLTKEIKELDVRLSKEIGDTRKEIKELDVKLTREIKELDVRLTKEIGDVRREIKELDVKFTKEIKALDVKIGESKLSIIKWVGGMMIGQIFIIGGLFLTAFKLFSH